MLRTGLYIAPDDVRIIDIAMAQRICQAERLPALPYLQGGREVENLGARVRLAASIEDAGLCARDRIVEGSVRERELIRGIDMVRDMPPGPAGLAEADVERRAAAADQ